MARGILSNKSDPLDRSSNFYLGRPIPNTPEKTHQHQLINSCLPRIQRIPLIPPPRNWTEKKLIELCSQQGGRLLQGALLPRARGRPDVLVGCLRDESTCEKIIGAYT